VCPHTLTFAVACPILDASEETDRRNRSGGGHEEERLMDLERSFATFSHPATRGDGWNLPLRRALQDDGEHRPFVETVVGALGVVLLFPFLIFGGSAPIALVPVIGIPFLAGVLIRSAYTKYVCGGIWLTAALLCTLAALTANHDPEPAQYFSDSFAYAVMAFACAVAAPISLLAAALGGAIGRAVFNR
jgi:hypothetical protein